MPTLAQVLLKTQTSETAVWYLATVTAISDSRVWVYLDDAEQGYGSLECRSLGTVPATGDRVLVLSCSGGCYALGPIGD